MSVAGRLAEAAQLACGEAQLARDTGVDAAVVVQHRCLPPVRGGPDRVELTLQAVQECLDARLRRFPAGLERRP